jgi:hypothetical protein
VDFIKKNWGLLLVSVLCLAATTFFAVKLLGARKKAKENRTKLEQELEFFKGVRQFNVKLTEANKQTALLNAEKAKLRFNKAREQLHDRFRIETSYDADPYVALQQLMNGIGKLRTQLGQERIAVPTQNHYLSFDIYAQSDNPPNPKQMPELFRQLKIVEEIVNLVVASKVAMLRSIARPMELEKQTEDLYTFIPITLSVVGTSESVSNLLNRFHTSSKCLFFIRKVELASQDQAPDGVLGGTGMTGGRGGTGGGTGGGMMDTGPGGGGMMDHGGGMPGGGMPGGGMPGGGMPGGDMMGGEGGMGATGLTMPTLLTREQLAAFKERYVQADIRLDLVEFITPDEEQGE